MLYDHEVGTRSKVTHSYGDAPGCTERAAVTWGQMMGLVNFGSRERLGNGMLVACYGAISCISKALQERGELRESVPVCKQE